MVVLNVLLQPAISLACSSLEKFVLGSKSNFTHTWNIEIPKIGKFKGVSIPVRIRKTKATITYKVSRLPEMKFQLKNIKDTCVIVVNAALAVA